MGLILAAGQSVRSVLADQWLEYFYCPEMDSDVLVRKGAHNTGKKGLFNRKGSDNVISNGSTIVVNDGQCMMIVDQGAIVDICAEPGAFKYDTSSSPSIFFGDLGDTVRESFKTFATRFAQGGVTGNDQRVYYFNIKDIIGNKYGTANPVPFRVVDQNVGLDIDISVKCFGEYVYRITDPVLFYKNVCGNVDVDFTRDRIDSQLKSELLTALQPAFAKISEMGIRYSALPGHTDDLTKALNEVLSESWGKTYGIQIVSCGMNSVRASEEDEKMIKELQRNAAFRNPTMAAAQLVGAQSQAMQDAAKNPNGAMMGFAGMNMAAGSGGLNAQQLFEMGQQAAAAQQTAANGSAAAQTAVNQPTQNSQVQNPQTINSQSQNQPVGGQSAPMQNGQNAQGGQSMQNGQNPQMQPAGAWTCPSCGFQGNNGRFCSNCGAPKPAAGPWTCPSCGWQGNEGKFCSNCGSPRPA